MSPSAQQALADKFNLPVEIFEEMYIDEIALQKDQQTIILRNVSVQSLPTSLEGIEQAEFNEEDSEDWR